MARVKDGVSDVRIRILEAASEVIRREGAIALTLDAVAREARVSKGGLLYHFANKEALVRGLLEYHLDQFEQALAQSGKPFAQAYVEMGSYDGSGGLIIGLMAALALYPGLLEVIQERYRRWYGKVPPSAGVMVALLATDGLFMADVMGYSLKGEARKRVLERMLELAQEDL